MRRYNITENQWRVNITDNTTGNTQPLSFAWFGSNQNRMQTVDFAPISEFQEVEPERYSQWRHRIGTDQQYLETQLTANSRESIWHNQMRFNGTTATSNCLTTATGNTTDVNGTEFWMTSDPRNFWRNEKEWSVSKLWYITKIKRHIAHLRFKINLKRKLNWSGEELNHEKAVKKSWELVKKWIGEEEFAELISKGEMEVQSKEDRETIYIIKRDPIATVQVMKNKKLIKQLCVIPVESGLPTGDAFLSKLLMLKADEKEFLKLAEVRNLA